MSTAARFHERTKYAPETIGALPGPDWAQQPHPYKDFRSRTRIELGPYLLVERDEESRLPVLKRSGLERGAPLDLAQLSTLLLHTNGVTGIQKLQEDQMFFRAAPSAGALYPTEIYVALRGVDGVPDGIYNFQVRDHTLAPVCDGDFGSELQALAFGDPTVGNAQCVFLFSSIFFRSTWRYGDRGYRRLLLDSGHVIGNLLDFAPELGLRAQPLAGFHDEGLNSLLLLDEKQEAMLAMVAILDETEAPQTVSAPPAPVAKVDSDDDLVSALHRASFVREAKASPQPPHAPLRDDASTVLSDTGIDWSEGRTTTILSRRSCRRFSGDPVGIEPLNSTIIDAYRGYFDPEGPFFAPARLETLLAVHRVEGIDAGLYRYSPLHRSLSPIALGDHSLECRELCLGQELGSDAACVLIHAVDLEGAVEAYGERAYRYVGLDAGMIGERLNLGAQQLGMGASGIGGYFDDQVNALFRLPQDLAIVYITCIGDPQTGD